MQRTSVEEKKLQPKMNGTPDLVRFITECCEYKLTHETKISPVPLSASVHRQFVILRLQATADQPWYRLLMGSREQSFQIVSQQEIFAPDVAAVCNQIIKQCQTEL